LPVFFVPAAGTLPAGGVVPFFGRERPSGNPGKLVPTFFIALLLFVLVEPPIGAPPSGRSRLLAGEPSLLDRFLDRLARHVSGLEDPLQRVKKIERHLPASRHDLRALPPPRNHQAGVAVARVEPNFVP
jgi:hypothetical protein